MPSQFMIPPIPADTVRAAKAAYSHSNLYLSIGDQMVTLLSELNLNNTQEATFPLGKPYLAFVTYFQYMEKLSDRQAAEATRTRVDWKYALHLSMNYPGLHPSALCDFRQSLLRLTNERQEFQDLLGRISERGCEADAQGRLSDAMDVLADVCIRTRLDKVMTGMHNVLQALATHFPEWLRTVSLPYWYSRYEISNRERALTQSIEQQQVLVEATGADIDYLLDAIKQFNSLELSTLYEVQELYRVRSEQFEVREGDMVRRNNSCANCFHQNILPKTNVDTKRNL